MAAAAAEQDILVALFGPDAASHVRDLPGVEQAVRSGSNRRLYEALRSVRGKAGSVDLNEAIARAVATRRHFWDPIRSGPSMYTLNGIGTRPYGRDEVDPRDGTYVKTLYFTVVYLPVWPIASYLVVDAESGAWRFFGKVPFSRFHRFWRRGLVGSIAALALYIGLAARAAGSHTEVRFVNALDVAVTTTLGPETVHLAPGSTVTRTIASGRHHIVTKNPANETIEELDVDVPRKTDLVAYNVLGAAPVVLQDIVYSTRDTTKEAPPTQEILVGRPWLVRDDIDYVLFAPPKSIQMSTMRETRHRAFVADGGWRTSVLALAGGGDATGAAALACRIALAERDDRAIEYAANFGSRLGGAPLLTFGEKAVAALPESIPAHRALQLGLQALGRTAEARSRYKVMYERDPSSSSFGYLYARLLPAAAAISILEKLVPAHPDDPWLRRALGANFHDLARFAEAVPHLERMTAIQPVDAKGMLPYLAASLAGSGRIPEAQRRVREAVELGDWALVVVYARLSRLAGADAHLASVDELIAVAAGGEENRASLRAEMAVEARDRVRFESLESSLTDAKRRGVARLTLDATFDVSAAAARAAAAADDVLRGLDVAAALSIALELAGTGREAEARRVYEADPSLAMVVPHFEQLAAPAATLDDPDLDLSLEARAVLAFAASRRASEPTERARFLALARTYDVLGYIVPR